MMRRYGMDAAVYPISRKKWEAPYPVDFYIAKSDFYESKSVKKKKYNNPLEKTTTNVGDRVFSKKSRRTAVIIDCTLERITIRFDDDGTESKYARNIWVIKTPFLPVLTTAI